MLDRHGISRNARRIEIPHLESSASMGELPCGCSFFCRFLAHFTMCPLPLSSKRAWPFSGHPHSCAHLSNAKDHFGNDNSFTLPCAAHSEGAVSLRSPADHHCPMWSPKTSMESSAGPEVVTLWLARISDAVHDISANAIRLWDQTGLLSSMGLAPPESLPNRTDEELSALDR